VLRRGGQARTLGRYSPSDGLGDALTHDDDSEDRLRPVLEEMHTPTHTHSLAPARTDLRIDAYRPALRPSSRAAEKGSLRGRPPVIPVATRGGQRAAILGLGSAPSGSVPRETSNPFVTGSAGSQSGKARTGQPPLEVTGVHPRMLAEQARARAQKQGHRPALGVPLQRLMVVHTADNIETQEDNAGGAQEFE
jgi:hypothetical protein